MVKYQVSVHVQYMGAVLTYQHLLAMTTIVSQDTPAFTTSVSRTSLGCTGFEKACCQTAGRPWFHKRLSAPTNDYIELRIGDGDSSAEDSPVGYYEIYIQSAC